MKLFKKLLAVAMVAVLALTVLTGCDTGTTDPDAVYPDDETESVVYALNNGALDKNVKIIVDVIPSTNPAKKSGFKYTELYKVTNYHLAEKVGVAFKDSSSGTRYLLICTFDVEE